VTNEDLTRETVTWTDPQTGLAVRAEVNVHHDFPAVEWVLYFQNTGPSDTPILENIQALDAALPLGAGERCVVRYAKGSLCSRDDFAPMERDLRPRGHLRLQPGGGRSSSEVLPFFNVELPGEGVILAIGWTGEWAADFRRRPEGPTRLQAGMDLTHLRLHPGEEIRTPRILLLCWEQDRWRGHNLLRQFILKHHRPRPNGEPLVCPLCNGNWGGTPAEVHLDNVRQVIEHDLPFEYYWIDAESPRSVTEPSA
jgi:alpha-galactosidase